MSSFLALSAPQITPMIIIPLILLRLTFYYQGIIHINLLDFLSPIIWPYHGHCQNNDMHIYHTLWVEERSTFLCLLWSRNMKNILHCHILCNDVGRICQMEWNIAGIHFVFDSVVCRLVLDLFWGRCTWDIQSGCFSGGIGAKDWSCHSEGIWHHSLCSSNFGFSCGSTIETRIIIHDLFYYSLYDWLISQNWRFVLVELPFSIKKTKNHKFLSQLKNIPPFIIQILIPLLILIIIF